MARRSALWPWFGEGCNGSWWLASCVGRRFLHHCFYAPVKCELRVPPYRFFGKFLGTHADYYVIETTLQNPPAEPEEQLGEG